MGTQSPTPGPILGASEEDLPVRKVLRPLSLALVPALAGLASLQEPALRVVPLAGERPAAVLAFEILASTGEPIPARLTFVPETGGIPDLFTEVAAAPRELAARKNVVYTRSGRGAITVPPGRYTVHASRGPEWSLASQVLELREGERATLQARLVHEVDTRGWISADFHLHTLTYSGHGDANLLERVLTFPGEGLEFAVATDHNHNTDYGPTVAELGVSGAVTTVTGNEVTTSIGHFNAFPFDPQRAPVDSSLTDANQLFRLIRAEPNRFGIVPVIQLNHPRWDGIDYFAQTGLDPVTGTSANPGYSRDFDSLEVFNENVGWGYFDPVADRVDTAGNRHSVLGDWFHLLNRGERYAAVGNSDSHHVQDAFAGYPRNFVRSSTDDPGAIDAREVASAIREKRVFTTLGPFVEFTVAGVPMGGDARAAGGRVPLWLRVQAASWIDCDRVKVVVNGDVERTIPVPERRTALRLEHRIELDLRDESGLGRDAWVALLVEGDDSLFPVVNDAGQRALPLAVANPVWIDGDGDGRWTSPLERIRAGIAARSGPRAGELRAWFDALPVQEQVLALTELPSGPELERCLERGFASAARAVCLAAVRAALRADSRAHQAQLEQLWSANGDDPYLAALLLRALSPDEERTAGRLVAYRERFGQGAARRHSDELLPALGGRAVTEWLALGFLDPSSSELAKTGAPAIDTDPVKTHAGRDGRALSWRALEARAGSSFVDLAALAPGENSERALAFAQTWLYVTEPKAVTCCFGTDDGSRVWLNDTLIYENPERRRANPLEQVASLELVPGWNRLLFQVENVSGAFGLYCRVLDPSVGVSAQPR